MCIQTAQHIGKKGHSENKEKNVVFSSMKNFFFHDGTRKIRTACKISTFFENLNFLHPRSHLKEHPLKGHMCNFKVGKTTYLKSQSITTYDDSKNKPLFYP